MSKEMQIEELSEILQKVCDATPNGKCMSKLCCVCRAETVIRAGYRKQKEGKNVSGTPSLYECSLCRWRDIDTYTADTSEYNYCPNCGARMKGGAE